MDLDELKVAGREVDEHVAAGQVREMTAVIEGLVRLVPNMTTRLKPVTSLLRAEKDLVKGRWAMCIHPLSTRPGLDTIGLQFLMWAPVDIAG